ncbi:glycosyltransferase family 4 protein [Pseudomonas matsuisoli]|uniref:Glycosyl transferase n=1 Tax=Pseudomonas matsuisoli TaxID=1515666 RepID=A0A917Q234_9PSED|nr:glycosyltransferase family 1 protein [Pseudomonas matsuisoli]GGK06874.1 glycosyl transferase [Pseudomonas matsuisoli]
MLITIVTETYPPDVNGVALTVHGLEQRLRQFGHQVTVLRPRRSGETDVPDTDLMRSIRLPRYPDLRLGLPAYLHLRRSWKKARPDVIYVATEGPLGASAVWAARSFGIPVATGYHTRFDQYMSRYGLGLLTRATEAWMRLLHNAGSATVVSTQALANELQTAGYQNVFLAPRAVDTSRFDSSFRTAALRKHWGATADTPVFLHVGRVAAEKNIELAIRAFRKVQQTSPKARMVLVGDGPLRTGLQAANPDLLFAGTQHGEALAAHYASADIFLFPSTTETFGNVTLEAMASGLAVVAFDDGAAREHIIDGVNGRLAPPEDETVFIAAACELVQGARLRRALGEAGRGTVLKLDPVTVARTFEQMLIALTASNPVVRFRSTGESMP